MRKSAPLLWLALLCGLVPAQGWLRMTDAPCGASNHGFSTGSALCSGDTELFCLKGRYNEFYSYCPVTNAWMLRESLPAIGQSMKKRYAGRGTSLVGNPQGVFCSKGNLSYELWRYAPDTTAHPWTQLPDVPMGARTPGEGSSIAIIDSFLYLVKGDFTYEFYRFNLNQGIWLTMPNYPSGASAKPSGSGGCVTAAQGLLYSLKGSSTLEFYSFDPVSLVWRVEPDIPSGPSVRGVGPGGCMAWDGRDTIYCLKGNLTNESWAYSLSAANWTRLTDMPAGPKYAGRGASLAAVGNAIYALRGNRTFEFWRYSPESGINGPPVPAPQKLSLTVSPSPARGAVRFDLSPGGRAVRLRVISPNGRTVRGFGTFEAPAPVNWDGTDKLGRPVPAGVYFCAAEGPAGRITRRFVKLGN
jgi:hypothetical protein